MGQFPLSSLGHFSVALFVMVYPPPLSLSSLNACVSLLCVCMCIYSQFLRTHQQEWIPPLCCQLIFLSALSFDWRTGEHTVFLLSRYLRLNTEDRNTDRGESVLGVAYTLVYSFAIQTTYQMKKGRFSQ